MIQYIFFLEMRGFAALATQLAREMEEVGVTPDRVRSAGITIANGVLSEAASGIPVNNKMHLGGDTWCYVFDTADHALRFATRVLFRFLSLSTTHGVFYLKPSCAIGAGSPRFDGERFLDDDSIATYREADKGHAFKLVAVGRAIPALRALPWAKLSSEIEGGLPTIVDWQASIHEADQQVQGAITLPALLLDSDIIYSQTTAEALSRVTIQQERSSLIEAFGGPVPLDVPIYRNYVRSFLATLQNNVECKWTLLSYLPLDEPLNTYAWLELGRRLTARFPERFAFSAFGIPVGQLRPFSYHIYDESIVHIGMRSFSPQRGTPTLSAGIMLRNRQIAHKFRDEFLEGYRRIGPFSEDVFAQLTKVLVGLSPEIRKMAVNSVEALLNE